MARPFTAGEIERLEVAVIGRPLTPQQRVDVERIHAEQGLDLTRAFFAAGAVTPFEAAALAAPRRTITSRSFAAPFTPLPFGTPTGLAPLSTQLPIPPPPPFGSTVQISARALVSQIPVVGPAVLPFLPISPLDAPAGARSVTGGIPVPFVSTGSIGFGEALGAGLGQFIGAIPGALGQIFSPAQQVQVALPGGSFPQIQQSARDRPIPGPSGPAGDPFQLPATAGGFESGLFRPTRASATPQIFHVRNPVTFAETWFGPLGAPLLWTRDLMAVKKVKRLARRARRAGG